MAVRQSRGVIGWVAAAVVGTAAGLVVWFMVLHFVSRETEGPDEHTGVVPLIGAPSTFVAPDPIAMQYAAAFQENNCEEVVRLTQWMQERLRRVRVESGDAAAFEAEKAALCARIRDRAVEGNQLRPEGIEDQYVFVPGARLEPVAVDEGWADLEQPVRQRVWIRVTYANRRHALRDETGLPVKAVTVGVNVSPEGLVLKAEVVGNVDILRETLSYDWEPIA